MKKSYWSLIVVSMIWGTSFMFIHKLNAVLHPGGVVFWRCTFGLIILSIFVLFEKGIKWIQLPWGVFLLVSLLNNVIPWLLISYGQLTIPSGVASVVNALTPISTMLLGIFFSKRINKNHWIGILLGYLGVIFLLNIGANAFSQAKSTGVLLVFVATLCYGTATQIIRKYLSNIPPTVIAFGAMAWSTPIGYIIMMETFPAGAKEILEFNNFFYLIILGCLGSGLAQILFFYMIREEGPTFASMTTYIVPIAALFWGVIFLSEKITLPMLLGMTFILSGVFMITRGNRKKGAAY